MSVAAVVDSLPLLTRVQVLEESDNDPRFMSYFAQLMRTAMPERVVDDVMTRVLINELEPRRFAEMAGRWPMLRAHLRRTIAIARGASGHDMAGLMDDGFGGGPELWEEITSVVSAVGTAASSAYTLYMQKRLAEARAAAEKRALAQEAARLAAEKAAVTKLAAQQAAVAQGSAAPGFPGYGGSGGWPKWATYAIIGVLGVVGVTVAVKMSRR